MSISNADEFLELLREDPSFGVHAYQILVPGSGVDPRELGEHFDLFDVFWCELCFHLFKRQFVLDLMSTDPFTHFLCGDVSVSFKKSRLTFALKQCSVSHDDANLQIDRHLCGLTDHHVAEENVSSDLFEGSFVALFLELTRFLVEVVSQPHARK